ncbi:MAG: hypothetical protein SH819_03040 [Cytophagales bacterium]|nr:hypothetical protein [Cytophagales bacterium]
MKTIIFFLAMTLACNSTAQTNFGFGDGFIITKQGDTIRCQVEMAVTYEDKIAYKKNKDDYPLHILTKDIHAMKTPYKYLQNILIGKKELLMSLMVDGKARLYSHVIINSGQPKAAPGGTMVLYQPPTVTYIVEKDKMYYEVKKKDFKTMMPKLLESCTSVTEKIATKKYHFEDIEKVIQEYNSCQ